MEHPTFSIFTLLDKLSADTDTSWFAVHQSSPQSVFTSQKREKMSAGKKMEFCCHHQTGPAQSPTYSAHCTDDCQVQQRGTHGHVLFRCQHSSNYLEHYC